MNKIVIIGGGFAGLSALIKFAHRHDNFNVTLIDRKEDFNFLPALPDIIGERLSPRHLTNNLAAFCKRCNASFLNEEVKDLDLKKRMVHTSSHAIGYDYLLIASGSQTNFYGNQQLSQYAYTLDTVKDAEQILRTLKKGECKNFIVGGGGYTGIEVATNLRRYCIRHRRPDTIVIVEKAPSLLGPLPGWMKEYVVHNLKSLAIKVCLNTVATDFQERKISLSNGASFDNSMFIWAAGVKTSDFITSLAIEKTPQGRIIVDPYLRLNDNCFVAGDAASVSYKGVALRMAVQFALSQGVVAAENIMRSIAKIPFTEYVPIDLGYIVPMANNKSCGRALGVNIRGVLGVCAHYFFCLYRSYGFRNRLGIIGNLIKGGA